MFCFGIEPLRCPQKLGFSLCEDEMSWVLGLNLNVYGLVFGELLRLCDWSLQIELLEFRN
jgi:hypothetical protein